MLIETIDFEEICDKWSTTAETYIKLGMRDWTYLCGRGIAKPEAIQWCEDNCEGRFHSFNSKEKPDNHPFFTIVAFANSDDAMMFRLTQ